MAISSPTYTTTPNQKLAPGGSWELAGPEGAGWALALMACPRAPRGPGLLPAGCILWSPKALLGSGPLRRDSTFIHSFYKNKAWHDTALQLSALTADAWVETLEV